MKLTKKLEAELKELYDFTWRLWRGKVLSLLFNYPFIKSKPHQKCILGGTGKDAEFCVHTTKTTKTAVL